VRVVIISRGRAKVCAEASSALFPSATVSVGEEEADEYVKAGIPKKNLLIHPPDVVGISKKRNWVLRNVDDECVVMLDDDCTGFACLVGQRTRKIKDEGAILQIFKNSEMACREIGTGYFGYNTVGTDLRKYDPCEPFRFIGFSAATHGIIGREVWYDEQFLVFEAVDYALSCIRRWRVIWLDYRFEFLSYVKMGYIYGGVQLFKTAARDRLEREQIKKKWGKYYSLKRWKSGEAISHLRVERKQLDVVVA
jgi:glycosyltransferase involved in cell wall biosynthesis